MVFTYYNPSAIAYLESPSVTAKFLFFQQENGLRVKIHVENDFPDVNAKYPYHIHQMPITGDCSTALKHLDPTNVNPNGNSPTYNCRKEDFSTCEVGDLSGKHGNLDGWASSYDYVDYTLPSVEELIDKRSIVIHLSDATKTRIACATIEGFNE